MGIKVWSLALILGVIAIAPVFALAYYLSDFTQPVPVVPVAPQEVPSEPIVADFEFESEKEKLFQPGAEFSVRSCKVVDGYRFQLYLDGGSQITGHLTSATKDEATQVVVELLNNITTPRPTVILRRKSGDNWIVDFYISVDGKRASLVEMLRKKELLLL